jgi:GNAT superfamily N-acetyltransferase
MQAASMASKGAFFTFRRAVPADIDALVDLRIDFMRAVKDGGIEDEVGLRAELAERFSEELGSGVFSSWICLCGEKAVATSGLSCPRSEELRSELGLGPGEALVFNMYTAPAYRRRGIASELLGRTIAEARSRGASALRLQSTDSGRSIYERAGFRESGRDMVLAL